jgi:hypothetical protein
MHTNKHNYIDQMVNREVLERVHERMNDELAATALATASKTARDNFAESTGTTPCIDPCTEDIPDNLCYIGQDQSQKIYLPRFLNELETAADPAYKVSTEYRQHADVFGTSDAN